MARLIEVPNVRDIAAGLTLRVGDVLLFKATGGHVQAGKDALEMLGAFLSAILGDNGEILTPMGAPNTVLFRAHRPGTATVDILTGDPWRAPHKTTVEITIES